MHHEVLDSIKLKRLSPSHTAKIWNLTLRRQKLTEFGSWTQPWRFSKKCPKMKKGMVMDFSYNIRSEIPTAHFV
jgi:hypothetical protein